MLDNQLISAFVCFFWDLKKHYIGMNMSSGGLPKFVSDGLISTLPWICFLKRHIKQSWYIPHCLQMI